MERQGTDYILIEQLQARLEITPRNTIYDDQGALIELDLSDLELSAVPAELGQLSNLQILYLSGNNLGDVPAELSQLSNLKRLYLNGNLLREVPAELGQLSNLQTLSLSGNLLREVPAELGQLSNLQTMELNGNRLRELPAELGQLSNLRRLDLDGNRLRKVPAELGQLKNLRQLYLDGNQLRELPAELGQLSNLQTLYLNSNQLRELPAELGQLSNLQTIYLNSNQLKEVPAELRLLSNLQTLDLDENPHLDRKYGEVAHPHVLLEFIKELSRRLHPGRVLDPFAVNPEVLASAVNTPSRSAGTGVVPLDCTVDRGKRRAPDVDWQHHDPVLASAAHGDARYDLIVSAPPFGASVEISLLDEDEPSTLASDMGDLVMFRALRQLSPSGVALVQVADSYFWDVERLKTRRVLESSGYHLIGVFSISDPRIQVASSVIVLTRSPVNHLFVARLKEASSVATIVENFLSRRPGDVFEFGRLVPVDEYGGWAQHAVLSTWGSTVPPTRLGDIATLKVRRITAGETLAPGENSVYLPTVGTGSVTTAPPSCVGTSTFSVLEAALDPERARADYVAGWLSSAAGMAARRAFTSGSTIPRLTAAGAATIPIDLPSIELQDNVTRAAQQLQSMEAKVEQLRDSLWRNPRGVWSTIAAELSRAAKADPLHASVDGLPYPLASVLRRYIAESATDRRVSRLLQYFEVTAEFSAIVLLSAFCRDAELFKNVQDLTKDDPAKHRPPLLERADFGQWIQLGFTLAKAARRADNDKKLKPLWSQAVGPASAVATLLSSVDYWTLLDRPRLIRNERAHGGVDSDTQSRTWLRQLDGMLHELVRITGSAWEQVRLLRPDAARLRSGVWTYPQAKLLVGSNDIFEEVDFTSLEPIETGQLVLASQEQGHEILPIVPLLRLDTPNTHTRIACYFFSARQGRDRDTFRYVSYHYEDEPQKTFEDQAVGDLIRSLTLSSDGQGN